MVAIIIAIIISITISSPLIQKMSVASHWIKDKAQTLSLVQRSLIFPFQL